MAAIRNAVLEIGVVAVPVGLFKMSEGTDVKLDRASANGNKIARKEVDAVTGEVVTSDSVQRGVFENQKEGTGFRAISAADLDAIEDVTRIDSFSIEDFVPVADVPFERVTGAYYLLAQSGVSPKPLRLLYEALRKTKRAGVFKLVLRSRQHLAVIYAAEGKDGEGALYVNTISFVQDFRRAKEAKEVIAAAEKPTAAMMSHAVALIEALSADASVIDAQVDDLIPLKQELVTQALAGKKLTKKAALKKQPVQEDALEAALRESVAAIKKDKKVKAKA